MSRKIDLNKLQHKSAGDKLLEVADTGRFSGYASVFGVLDDQGEIIHKGAFSETIAAYAETGKRLPVLSSHSLKDPVGYIDNFYEDDIGLWVDGVIMHETSSKAKETYDFAKEGVISEMSVGFYYVDGGSVYDEVTDTLHTHKADLREVSLVTIGSNNESRIVAVKSAGEPDTVAPEPTIDLTEAFAILSRVTDSQTKTALDQLASVINRLEV